MSRPRVSGMEALFQESSFNLCVRAAEFRAPKSFTSADFVQSQEPSWIPAAFGRFFYQGPEPRGSLSLGVSATSRLWLGKFA